MNREQQERIEDLGRNIVNAIIDVIDSDFVSINDVRGIPYEEGTSPSTEPVRNTKAAYEPVITQVNNGFTVRCGCQTFVFETFEKMSKYLKMYFEDPAETEEKFYKNELFK
jgi:hypothetical protein